MQQGPPLTAEDGTVIFACFFGAWITTYLAKSPLSLALLGGSCPGWVSHVCGAGAVRGTGGWEKGCREGQGRWQQHPPAAAPAVGPTRVRLCALVTSCGRSTVTSPELTALGIWTGKNSSDCRRNVARGTPQFSLQAWLYALLLLLLCCTTALIWTLLLHSGLKSLSP